MLKLNIFSKQECPFFLCMRKLSKYAKEQRVTPPNREGLDLVRGENVNSSCVTKAARIIYASVQEATVKSRIYSEERIEEGRGSMCAFGSARVPALLVSELRATRELSSLPPFRENCAM